MRMERWEGVEDGVFPLSSEWREEDSEISHTLFDDNIPSEKGRWGKERHSSCRDSWEVVCYGMREK